jgi:hypothetical protein
MLELAGELADGIVLWMCGPSHPRGRATACARGSGEGEQVDGRLRDRGGGPDSLTTNLTVRERCFVRWWSDIRTRPTAVMDLSGYAEELAAGKVSDALVDDLSAIGDEAQIKQSLARFRDAGVTLPCVFPIGSHDGAAGYVPTLEAAREA